MNKVRNIATSDLEPIPGPVRPLLTLADIEARTGLSASKLRRDIRSKRLACLRFGRAIRITEAAYEAYLQCHQ
jgi:excisionase family DNA binding protein